MTSPRKVYSRYVPGLWAEVFTDPDIQGNVAALVHPPNADEADLAGAIQIDEWSDAELIPISPGIPETGFLIIHGDDPLYAEATFVETEKQVAQWRRAQTMFGYVPIAIQRTMLP